MNLNKKVHVVIALSYEGQECLVIVTIPDVPEQHTISVGEAIMNLDTVFEDKESLSCINIEGNELLLPLDDDAPKSSQIMTLASSIQILSDDDYREMVADLAMQDDQFIPPPDSVTYN